MVEESLLFYHSQRYELRAWVVMPNHVHVLFKVGEVSMSQIVEDWKKFTAHAINKLLGFENRVAMTSRPKHDPTEQANEQVYRFFEWGLKDRK